MNGLQVFEFQVAGSHSSSTSNLLRGEFGRVLKPYKEKATSPLRTSSPDHIQPNKEAPNTENENFDRHEVVCPDERAFYELCAREEAQLQQLRAFLPAFYGDTTVCTAGHPTRYLVLEDLTARCELPCVADLKMGVSRHYPGKPPRKLRADKEKYPSLRDTGWCIAGLLQHAPHGPLIEKFGPATGRAFSTQQVHARMTTFIAGARGSAKRRQLVHEITTVLEGIQKWFSSQRRFWFRSSSILVVYNAEYFFEDSAEKSGNYSQLKVDARRSVPPKKDASFSTDVQRVDQTDLTDEVQTGRLQDGEKDKADETSSHCRTVTTALDSSASSSRYIETHRSEDEASTANEISVLSQRDGDASELGRSNAQSLPSGEGSNPKDQDREIELCSDPGTVAETVKRPETSSALGTIAEIVENADSSCAPGVLDTEVQKKLDLDKRVNQRFESMPKKMKLESSADRSCLNHEKSETDLNSSPLNVRVKMIDFAHVLEAGGEPDNGYITGLNNLLQFLHSIA